MVTNYQIPETESYYQSYDQYRESDLFKKLSNRVTFG